MVTTAARIYNSMPTQREPEHHNPEIKSDQSLFRLLWLSHMGFARLCWYCALIRVCIQLLALYGLYSLITHIV